MATNTTEVQILDELGNTEFIHVDLRKKHRFPTHFHNSFVIELVLAGEDWCSDAEMLASDGEVYVHFPFAPHTGGTHGSKPLIYQAIYPSISFFCELTGAQETQIPFGCSYVSGNQKLVGLTKRLFGRFGNTSGYSGRKGLKHLFEMILIHHAASKTELPSLGGDIDQKMLVAREFLLKNYVRDISIDELSVVCEISPFHLIRSFKKRFGITPRQFLISHRVAAAKQLIASGTTITAAAYRTGFSDHSHLTRNFKRITSYRPRQMKSLPRNG